MKDTPGNRRLRLAGILLLLGSTLGTMETALRVRPWMGLSTGDIVCWVIASLAFWGTLAGLVALIGRRFADDTMRSRLERMVPAFVRFLALCLVVGLSVVAEHARYPVPPLDPNGEHASDAPNLLLVTFDALEASALAGNMPFLGRLADEGRRFERVALPSWQASTNLRTLMTGMHERNGANRYMPLATALLRVGFFTGAFEVGTSERAPWWGIVPSQQGFSVFRGNQRAIPLLLGNAVFRPTPGRAGGRALAPARRFLDEANGHIWFIWLHVAVRDGGFGDADAALGEMIGHVEATGSLDQTLVVVTALGGASGQGPTPTVPMVLRQPPKVMAGTRSECPLASVDLVPTVLALLGMDMPRALDGRELPFLDSCEPGGSATREMP